MMVFSLRLFRLAASFCERGHNPTKDFDRACLAASFCERGQNPPEGSDRARRSSRLNGISCHLVILSCCPLLFLSGCGPAPQVRIGSKQQPESVTLGEMATPLARLPSVPSQPAACIRA